MFHSSSDIENIDLDKMSSDIIYQWYRVLD